MRPFDEHDAALYEKAWNAGHADLLILSEADRMKARTLIADYAGGDFNAADGLIGLLHRNEFEVVSAKAMVALLRDSPPSGRRLSPRPAPAEPGGPQATHEVTREQIVEAMQDAWDSFVADTGCPPDCFSRTGRLLYADFAVGTFATYVRDCLTFRPAPVSTAPAAKR